MDNRLAAIIAHDIKNSLGVLEGELHAMTIDPSRELAVAAHETCAAMRERLVGFLTLYKASCGALSAHGEAVDVEGFLSRAGQRACRLWPHLDIRCDAGSGPAALWFFDEHLVELALDAAMQNAARFARSAIVIGAHIQEGGLALTVADDGPGLGTAEEKPSTGLGMALCAAIAQAHRRGTQVGRVGLQNDARGGVLFTLRLP